MRSSHAAVADRLLERRLDISLRVADRHLAANPAFLRRFGAAGRARCIEDTDFHLQYLAHALRVAAPALFVAYTQWARQLLEKRRIPWEDLQKNLVMMRDEIERALDPEGFAIVGEYIAAALAAGRDEPQSFLSDGQHAPLARAYLEALLAGDRRTAITIIDDAVRNKVAVRDLYLQVFQPAQREIGRLWQNNEITVAEEHFCSASTQAMMAQFYPQILSTPRKGRKSVVACVGDELHEIGARMIADFFEMDGWDTLYIGANTPTTSLVELVAREHPHVVALSITIAVHLGTASEIIARLREDHRTSHTKILAGGYVFQQKDDLWKSIGADGTAADADAAVAAANELVNGPRT